MAAINKENLDERIERIKKRNEEIEKKYREAEEDRLMALKDNAMVETKPPKDEDWPKGHKYDKIDFTYDVKPEKLEELNQKKPEEVRTKRDYKKFPDGEGPPPDPAYNFLADAERDGVVNQKNENKERKDPRQVNRNKEPNNKRNGPGNNSFRGRGGKIHNPKYQKQNSQPEYEQWRNEREKIDEARINRQKVGDGKWRREWDNDKINSENEALLRPERVTLGDAINVTSKKSPTHCGKNTQNWEHHQNTECLVEKRGNITVSVSQTGEVKSVKLSSAPIIGTGRVGPRQPSKTQFSIQSVEKDVSVQTVPSSPRMQNKNNHKNTNNSHKAFAQTQHHNKGYHPNSNQKTSYPQKSPTRSQNSVQNSPSANVVPIGIVCPQSPLKNRRKQQNPKQVPNEPNEVISDSSIITATIPVDEVTVSDGNDAIPVDLSHKPEFAKRSVQDRLLRARQVPIQPQRKTVGNNGAKSNRVEEVSADPDVISLAEAKEKSIERSEATFDKANESIQTAEPIAACN